MVSREEMGKFLDGIRNQWHQDSPSPGKEKMEQVMKNLINTVPDSLLAVYDCSNGGSLGKGIYILSIDDIVEYNRDVVIKWVPSAVVFAADEESNLFFLDTDNSLDRGVNAVFCCKEDFFAYSQCVFCSKDIVSFFNSTTSGYGPEKNLTMEKVSIESMMSNLLQSVDKWEGNAGLSTMMILDNERKRLGKRMPFVLKKLFEYSNGVYFKNSGTQIWNIEDIEVLSREDGTLLIGQISNGLQLGITAVDLEISEPDYKRRVIPEGFVFYVRPGQSLAEQEIIGYLPKAIAMWL